jgi:predicted TIM-barrel fold metal-dependent hydrolase
MSASPAQAEEVLEPDLRICDPHHHLMDYPGWEYGLAEFQRDLASGHRVTSTVFVESGCFYRSSGPKHLRSVGEIEFARRALLETRGRDTEVARAIVGFADLTQGASLGELLDAQLEAAGGALKGVRPGASRDPTGTLHARYLESGPELYERADFRAGVAELVRRDLSLDTWQYFYQLPALIALAQNFPDLRIVVDHVGGIVGVGPYANKREEMLASWRASIAELARLPNVWVKLGGLGMDNCGFDFHTRHAPAGSEEIAAAWAPYMLTCIEAFEPERCMFESNFPVDRPSCSYRTLWNALKRVAQGASAHEKALLFHDTAARFYRLPR